MCMTKKQETVDSINSSWVRVSFQWQINTVQQFWGNCLICRDFREDIEKTLGKENRSAEDGFTKKRRRESRITRFLQELLMCLSGRGKKTNAEHDVLRVK